MEYTASDPEHTRLARQSRVVHPCSWLLALTLLLALSGCTGGLPTGRTTATTRPIPSPTALPVFEQAPLTMQQAWGTVTVRTLPQILGVNQFFVFDNATTPDGPDGQSLIGVNEPCNFLQNPGIPSYLMLYNIATRQTTTLTPLLTTQSVVLAAAADTDWIAWVEADGFALFLQLDTLCLQPTYRPDRALGTGGEGREWATCAWPFSGPVIDHDQVIWGQPIGSVKASLSNAVVRREDLTTGVVTTLATNAGNVGLSWPWASWSQATTDGAGYQAFRNLLTGQTLQVNEQTNYVAFAGTTVAFVRNDSTLFLLNDITRSTDTSAAEPLWIAPGGNYIDFPTMNDRLIGWNQNSAAEVYDRQLQKIVTLPTPYTQTSATTVDHHLLVWGDGVQPGEPASPTCTGEPPGALKVVDTSTLPTRLGG